MFCIKRENLWKFPNFILKNLYFIRIIRYEKNPVTFGHPLVDMDKTMGSATGRAGGIAP